MKNLDSAPAEGEAVRGPKGGKGEEESVSQLQLIWRDLKRHRLAMAAALVLIVLYALAFSSQFVSPYDPHRRFSDYLYASPTKLHFIDNSGDFHFRPFIYNYEQKLDPVTWRRTYHEDKEKKYFIHFFVRGDEYKFLGLFETDLHLFGVEGEQPLFLFGADSMGRDFFSRILFGSRISLTIGLVGVFLSLVIGLILGGVSGLYGGYVDDLVQRFIEFLISIPQIPLWMGLSAALPPQWSQIKVYFGITIILSIIGWTSIARVVRGKFLSLREEDFVMAAQALGASKWRVITRHLIPSFLSYIIVNVTLSIPGMILGETALSFLGIGLRAPTVSWGVLLQAAQNVRSISLHPWLLLPGAFVVITVLAFNFLGDGLRDAADPYSALEGR